MSQTEEEKAFFTGVNVIGKTKITDKSKTIKSQSKRAASALPKKQKNYLTQDNEINYRHVSYNYIT